MCTDLERDLQDLATISSLPDFRRLMQAACLRLGQLLNQTELGRDVALPQPTVHRWLNLLETSCLLVRLSALSPGQAQAFVVNMGGNAFDVNTFTGSHNTTQNRSKFALPSEGGVMPWWGSESLANMFAQAYLQDLAAKPICQTQGCNPNGLFVLQGAGPLFAWGSIGQSLIQAELPRTSVGAGGAVSYSVSTRLVSQSAPFAWAQASQPAPPTPAPGPLPLFGAAAAFGFSRKLRKRIKLAPAALGSALPLA